MSELAFNANGDNFEIPATVTGWRVRRLKPRGAPELVYGRDGRPLTVPIECDMDELRDAVSGVLGRYRLDPINDDGKIIDSVPAAYIHVVKGERPPEAVVTPSFHDERDSLIREAMRHNTELSRTVIEKFPEVMQAAAELLRAADGAGLPARQPREIEEPDDDDDEEDVVATGGSSGIELINSLLAQIIPVLVASFAGKKVPKLGAILDWRKAVPETMRAESAPSAGDIAPTSELPPLDPKMMSHFIAIQSALTPDEATLARHVASELSPAEMRAWFHELSALSVPESVAKIRSMIGGAPKTGGAS